MLDRIVSFLDDYLEISLTPDDSLNGLQVENSGEVTRIGVAVDASEETFRRAEEKGIDFLIVHHGLFWKEMKPLRGNLYRRIKCLMDKNIALYAAHLPLDKHPEVGNNAVGIRILGGEKIEEFGEYRGVKIGYIFHLEESLTLEELKNRVEERFKTRVNSWDFGKREVRKGAFVSGSALGLLPQVVEKKLDFFITGEPSHSWFWEAKENKVNVIFAGHYLTEILGVRELGKLLSREFSLPWELINLPTGL